MKIHTGLDRSNAPFFYVRKYKAPYSNGVFIAARLWIAWITIRYEEAE